MPVAMDHRIAELKSVLDTTIAYLQSVRESNWGARLQEIRTEIEVNLESGIKQLVGAFDGREGLNGLYLSGPRNGHSLSERQEIEANGKLYVLRDHLYALANSLSHAGA